MNYARGIFPRRPAGERRIPVPPPNVLRLSRANRKTRRLTPFLLSHESFQRAHDYRWRYMTNGGIIFSKMVRTADPGNGYVDIGNNCDIVIIVIGNNAVA